MRDSTYHTPADAHNDQYDGRDHYHHPAILNVTYNTIAPESMNSQSAKKRL
jgi:hypothetical protein